MNRSKRLGSVCAGAFLAAATGAAGQPVIWQHNEQGAPGPEVPWWAPPHWWALWDPFPLESGPPAVPAFDAAPMTVTPAPATWIVPLAAVGLLGRRR